MIVKSVPGTETRLPSGISLTDELGTVWPTAGSLGWRFIVALAIGSAIGVVVGIRSPDPVTTGWAMLASLLLWQPLTEELLFRGLLQGFLARTGPGSRTKTGISLANVMTSCVFVLFHFVHHAPAWALAVFVPSLLFGYFRDRSGSIWPPLLLHISFNTAFFAC